MTADKPDQISIADKLAFTDMSKQQLAALAALKPLIDVTVGPALDRFYTFVTATPQTARHFRNAAHVDHAKEKQVEHWGMIATGKFDHAYIDGVTRIGKVHAKLGLEPSWYIGGYALVLEELVRGIIEQELGGFGSRRKASKTSQGVTAVIKAALIDMDYAISVYLDELSQERARVEREQARLKADQDKALEALEQALTSLSEGNLGATMSEPLAAEFDQLKANFNTTVTKLNDAFTDIVASIKQSGSETRELSSATDDMARRTEQQAASLEQTAAAVEQISTISRQSAERTGDARQIVDQAAQQAAQSGETVNQAIAAMGKIEESSKKITQIITVIDEISFQTNLLALNAGVEAARAGEAGRGFAVVAQEVRELAQRSASAAKEIKELIEASFSDVLNGVSLVNKTGEALSSIGGQVRVISEHFTAISQSAQEQSLGIAEINTAVTSMDQITQQNAAMVEETNAATQNLLGLNQTLAELASRFTLSATTTQEMTHSRLDRVA
ncbi:globin-coupled sensor protein [Hoeflea sp. YIM 152468]|uniref:globin-coupled sensor protein n=1 Tax=Hoeflea sp. YIM 152468 TaxID=3031759 RepID=UPI0023DC131D|nr:globin-coupled sensor protein [Hoeflea sp. YIM 152468]MDF1608424.1 globin-coupled sensor protein [Hoeflea sp. YIM 152468]